MNVYLLMIDPDTGHSSDIETVVFSTRVRGESAKLDLIENGCESILEIRELRVSDQWEYSEELGEFVIPVNVTEDGYLTD